MEHADAAAQRLGKGVGLLLGRAGPGCGGRTVQQVIDGFQPQATGPQQAVAIAELRVETVISIALGVVEFAAEALGRTEPSVAQKRLSPQPGCARIASGLRALVCRALAAPRQASARITLVSRSSTQG